MTFTLLNIFFNAIITIVLWRLKVMKRAHVARQRLLRLGVFKDVEVLIDTSEGKLAVFEDPLSPFFTDCFCLGFFMLSALCCIFMYERCFLNGKCLMT